MDEKICKDIKIQFSRVKGQVNGVEKMMTENRDPLDIIQQISAIKSGLNKVALDLIREESKSCFEENSLEERVKKFEELVESFFKIN